MANSIFELAKGLPPWVILALGVATGSLRAVWSFIYEHTIGYAMTRVSLSLTVEDVEHREAYLWLNYWVESNLRNRRINSLLLRKHEDDEDHCAKECPQFQLIPEYGTYYMKYKKRLMVIEHRKDNQPNMNRMRPMHYYMRLQIWLSWDRNMIFDILREAKATYEQTQSASVEYFRTDQYGDWTESAIPARSLKSLYHPEDLVHLFGFEENLYGTRCSVSARLPAGGSAGYGQVNPNSCRGVTFQIADLLGTAPRNRANR